ncbi:MAG TPA: hypothetical protein VHO06_02315 [Polyangia bacterium]|nr:hypothetical protein [Polyangia bacterium]
MKHDDEPSRLAEHPGLDPRIGRLLRSTDPYKAPPGRKQRVLLGLGRSGPRRAPVLLRAAIVTGVLIGFGAIASAALGPWRGWLGRTYARLVSHQAPSATGPTIERVRARRPAAAPPLALVATPPAAPVVTEAPPTGRASVPPPHLHRLMPAAPAPQTPQAEQDTQLVLEGMRALRLDHDPVRARALLAGYLDRRPGGALAEEALALTIEAAVAHHDGDGPALAARYLRRYPAGPFRALAQQAQREQAAQR